MAVGVRSFSCLLDIDTLNVTGTMTILKNTFSVTPTLQVFEGTLATSYIRWGGIIVDPLNCVMNTNFGLTLVSGSGVALDKFGLFLPNLSINIGSVYTDISIIPKIIDSGGTSDYIKTYQPFYFNFKEFYSI